MLSGKFSIRLVPNLTVASVTDLVVKYVQEEFKKLGSKNKMEVYLTHGGEPWIVRGVTPCYIGCDEMWKTNIRLFSLG